MENKIEVRPLRRGEEFLWVSLGVEESERETRRKRLVEHLAKNHELPAANYLLAFVGSRVVGKVSGILESTGYIATKMIVAADVDANEISAALFNYVRSFGPLQALSWADREEDREWRQILEQNGFSVLQDKAYFRRSIANYTSPPIGTLIYKSMAEVGFENMLEIFSLTYVGNLNRNFSSPESDFASHRESAGHLFDPNNWYVAYLGVEPIGVVLPQRFPDSPQEGTLMSFGVLTQHRGHDFGKALHAKGLEVLALQGATDYIGSTDIENSPMIRIFEVNGCKRVGIRTTHLDSSHT